MNEKKNIYIVQRPSIKIGFSETYKSLERPAGGFVIFLFNYVQSYRVKKWIIK